MGDKGSNGSVSSDPLHQSRNRFTHGHPEAIDDVLVEELVASLKDEHEGWIAVFNKRLYEARKSSAAPRGKWGAASQRMHHEQV